MKTPQEQAEEMAWKLAKAQHKALRLSESRMINANGHGIDYLFWDNCRVPLVETLQREIPLPELITVAQAATNLTRAVGFVEQHNCSKILVDAIIALRATGKVEL